MESSSSSKWCNLPSDILVIISKKLDGKNDHQLSAVCTSWNSSLPKSPSKAHSSCFPLEIPCPIIPTPETKDRVRSISKRFRFLVVERSMLLVSPLKKEAEIPAAWIAQVEETDLKKRSLFNPLTGDRISPCRCNRYGLNNNVNTHINLLDFCVSDITNAYTVLWADKEGCYHTHSCSPSELSDYIHIKKVITFHVLGEGIIILLALRDDGKLASWKSGCQEWKIVDSLQPHDSNFFDIICYDGTFCAVDLQGNLTMIDPLTLKPIKTVALPYNIAYYDMISYLVLCEEYLYLVKVVCSEEGLMADLDDIDAVNDPDVPIDMMCFVLAKEGWVANGGFEAKSHIFFLGGNVTYSLSAKQIGWPRGNFAYLGGMLQNNYELITSEVLDLFMNMRFKETFTENYGPYGSIAGIYDYQDRSFTALEINQYPYLDVTNIFCTPRN